MLSKSYKNLFSLFSDKELEYNRSAITGYMHNWSMAYPLETPFRSVMILQSWTLPNWRNNIIKSTSVIYRVHVCVCVCVCVCVQVRER